jgi:N-acetylmuramoyl-L-alanine amidase
MLTFLMLGDSVLLFPVKDYALKGRVLSMKGMVRTDSLPAFVDSVAYRRGKVQIYLNDLFAYNEVRGDTLVLYSKRVFAVVVDPGHGGTDFGAFGVSGIREKDITLAVGLKLAEVLEGMGYRVVLTRREDRFVSLFERGELANSIKAKYKVYVSLHCNFMSNPRAEGLETYILTLEKVTDRRAAVLIENMPYAQLGEVKGIIGDMLQNLFLEDSRELALTVHSRLMKYTKDRGIRQANFYVLRQIYFPSVLVELGYVSNLEEVGRLEDKNYQNSLAKDIASGIDDFFNRRFFER